MSGRGGAVARIGHVGKEPVEVPAGTFEANHLVLTQKSSADTWFKKRAGHLPRPSRTVGLPSRLAAPGPSRDLPDSLSGFLPQLARSARTGLHGTNAGVSASSAPSGCALKRTATPSHVSAGLQNWVTTPRHGDLTPRRLPSPCAPTAAGSARADVPAPRAPETLRSSSRPDGP